jgi:hypothetical protein
MDPRRPPACASNDVNVPGAARSVLTEEDLGGVAGGGLWDYLFGGSGSQTSTDIDWDGTQPDDSYAPDKLLNPNIWSPERGWNSAPDASGTQQGGIWWT